MSVLRTYTLPNSSESTPLPWAKAFSMEQKHPMTQEKCLPTQAKFLQAQEKFLTAQGKYLSCRVNSNLPQLKPLPTQYGYLLEKYKYLQLLKNIPQPVETLLPSQDGQHSGQRNPLPYRLRAGRAQTIGHYPKSNNDSPPYRGPMVRWQKGCCRAPPYRNGPRPQPTTMRSPIFN